MIVVDTIEVGIKDMTATGMMMALQLLSKRKIGIIDQMRIMLLDVAVEIEEYKV